MDKSHQFQADQAARQVAQAQALLNVGRWREAEQHYRQALGHDASCFDALVNLGGLLIQTNRPEEALPHLQEALALRPDAVETHNNLAIAYAYLSRNDDAIAHLKRVMALKPEHEPAYQLLVRLLMSEGRGDDAAALLASAHAERPQLSFLPLMLAEILRVVGRLEEARAVIEPMASNGQHYYLLAGLKQFSAGDVAAMEALNNASMQTEDRVALLFALAKAYGDIGAPERGFTMLGNANRLKRSTVRYDEPRALSGFARVRKTFTPERLRAGAGCDSSVPVFILGMPRSGTTLVEQILTSHPEIAGAGENAIVPALLQRLVPDFPEGVARLTANDLHEFGASYLAAIGRLAEGRSKVTDKSLDLAHYAGLLNLALPNARFIWVRRDAVDCCLSCFSCRFAEAMDFTYDLAELGRYHRAFEELMRHWQSVLPAGVLLTVNYEDVVADLEGQVRRMLDHCGVGFDAACLQFHRSKRPVFTASAAQVRRPLYATSVGRWRPSPDRLRPLLQALGRD